MLIQRHVRLNGQKQFLSASVGARFVSGFAHFVSGYYRLYNSRSAFSFF